MSSELIIAMISAISAIVAAIVAAIISASSTKKTGIIDAQSQQLRDLDSRNAERKSKIYEPIIELFSMLLMPHSPAAQQWRENHQDSEVSKTLNEFAKWAAIYGSDGVVTTFHDLSAVMNALGTMLGPDKDVWPFLPLIYRLYGEFVMAVRRDLGHPDTNIEVRYVLASGGFDFYKSHLWPTSCLPLGKLYKKYREEYNLRPGWADPSLLNKSDTEKAMDSYPKAPSQVRLEMELLAKLEKMLEEQSSLNKEVVMDNPGSSQDKSSNS